MPGIEVERNADTIGKVAAGVIAGGVAAHAVAATVSKRKQVKDRIQRAKTNEKNIDE